MEAVIFEGMAYPLDGRDPYPVDMSGYIRPFTVQMGGDSNDSVPFFALCNALNIPYEWDEETGVVTAARNGVTLTFTRDSAVMGMNGQDFEDPQRRLETASVYQDGELWVDAPWVFPSCWGLWMIHAFGDEAAWIVVP